MGDPDNRLRSAKRFGGNRMKLRSAGKDSQCWRPIRIENLTSAATKHTLAASTSGSNTGSNAHACRAVFVLNSLTFQGCVSNFQIVCLAAFR